MATEAEKKQVVEAQQKLDELQRQANEGSPAGKSYDPAWLQGVGKDTQIGREYSAWLKTTAEAKAKLPTVQAEYQSMIANPELAAYAKEHPATPYEVSRYATNVTGYSASSQPDRSRNKADIDVRRTEMITGFAKSNPNASIQEIDKMYGERSSSLNPPNVTIDYEGTLAARQQGYNVGSGLTRNLPETFQKDEDRRFAERNKIISLTESMGGPRPKTDYFVGLTEGGKQSKAYTVNLEEGGAEASRSKEFAVSLSEGAPKKPRELSEAQVAELSERDYAVYASEFAPYNEFVKQENEKIRVEGLANWKEFKGDIKTDVADLKKQGVKFVTIKSDSGYETVPIDKAVNRIVRGKNVTSIAAVPEIPKGFTVAGSPQELILVEEDKRRIGPDQAYQGEFKDPRKGTQSQGLFERAASAGASLYGETAKLGVTIMSGLVGASQSVKSFADEITGNVTVTNQTIPITPPADLEQAPVSQPLSAPIPTQTSSQKAVAVMGGGMSTQERNVGTLRQSLDQIVATSNRREAVRTGEDPFMFAVKEQKPQSLERNYLDVREGLTTGLTYFGESVFTLPKALYEFGASGGDSKAGEAVFEKRIEELQKGGLGPSVIGSAISGRGTGRTPYYNIGEGIGEILPMFLPTKGGAPKIQTPLSATTKARLLTKSTASREGNIYGIETVKPSSTAKNFVSQRIENIKQKFRKPDQFLGSIGTEAERDAFRPLSKGVDPKKPQITAAQPERIGVGPKGERIVEKRPEIVEPIKGKPSETPALIIDTGEGGLTGIVRAQPRETITNQIGVILRGDIAPATAKKLGLKQISAAIEDKPPVFAARLPKGAKKREKFLSEFEQAEKAGFIKRVTDIDFIPTETALKIERGGFSAAKGRKGVGFGSRKESYGPKEIDAQFKTAPYYETKQSFAKTPREVRGAKTGKKTPDLTKRISDLTPEEQMKLSKTFESEFGSPSFDRYLREVGMSSGLEPKAAGKKTRPYASDFEKKIGTGGSAGKGAAISTTKALEIAGNIKPLTQGVKSTEAPIRPEYGVAYTGSSSAYDFETEVTGRYSISPIGATEPRIDIKVRDVFDTKSNIGLVQRDLIAEGSKQVQPTITQQSIRTDSITKSGLKEDEKLKNRLLDKLVFRNDVKQTPRTQTRLQTGQQLKQTPIQKQIQQVVPKVPFRPPPTRPPRPPQTPTIRIPEIEKRKSKRDKKEKEKQDFFGNVQQENIAAAGYKKYDIRYGKRATKEAALDLTKGRKGRQSFSENRSDSFLSKKDNMFTEKKPKKIGKDGFAKAGKKYSW